MKYNVLLLLLLLQHGEPSVGFAVPRGVPRCSSCQLRMTLPELSSVVTSRKRSREETDDSSVPDKVFVPAVPLVQLALAGAVTTFVADVMIHPMDCIKTLQQSDLGWELGLHNSLGDAAQYLWTTSGLAGFYHGFLVYAGSDALAGAAKFATWEWWKRNMPSTILFVGAGIAFLSSSLFLVPGELVKQQLQMGLYPDFSAAVQGIAGSAGVEGFLVGYDATCYRDVPYTMLELGVYELLKKAFDNESKSTLREVGAASITGAIAAFLTTPMDTIKTKLMLSEESCNYWDCAMNTLESHGVEGLFSGMEARISWIVPFVCIYLPLYDNIKRLLIQRHEETQRL